jgi:hypothetical protein
MTLLGEDGGSRAAKRRTWIVLLSALGVGLVIILGSLFYQLFVAGPVRPSVSQPTILDAYVTQASGKTNCGVVTQGYPLAAVCDVSFANNPLRGTMTVDTTTHGTGDARVEFGFYSPESVSVYVNSSLSCVYTSTQIPLNSGCLVPSNANVKFTFEFSALKSTTATHVVFTLVMIQTWPPP